MASLTLVIVGGTRKFDAVYHHPRGHRRYHEVDEIAAALACRSPDEVVGVPHFGDEIRPLPASGD